MLVSGLVFALVVPIVVLIILEGRRQYTRDKRGKLHPVLYPFERGSPSRLSRIALIYLGVLMIATYVALAVL
jgi:hypothetical protein